jgi:hypothetical protein
LNIVDWSKVAKMISFSWQGVNQTVGIEFNKIVTDIALREHFGYAIPEDKVLLDQKGSSLKKKKTDVPKASAPGGAPMKSSKKRTGVLEAFTPGGDPNRSRGGATKSPKVSFQKNQN